MNQSTAAAISGHPARCLANRGPGHNILQAVDKQRAVKIGVLVAVQGR
jgi:hypothetical protein